MANERELEDAILRECHKRDASGAVWCMRELSEHNTARKMGKCMIVDSRYFTPKVIAQAETWDEILAKLKEMP
jgi:hypothetical protein